MISKRLKSCRMKLKSDLYTANGTRELIVTDQIYNSIQFDEEKTTVAQKPPSVSRKVKQDDKDPKTAGKEDKRRRRTPRESAKDRKGDKSRSGERGKEERRRVKSQRAKSDSSVITEMTSVKSSKISSRYCTYTVYSMLPE